MRELIVSKDVRKYLQKRKHVFSDVEIATLVSNNLTWSLSEKHQALRGLLKVTKDKELIRQIQERISWDIACVEKIETMTGNFIFQLKVREGEDDQYQSAGYFGTYKAAKRYATKSYRAFRVYVIELQESEEWTEEGWGDSEKACIQYNERGDVINYWGEMCSEPWDTTCEKRFEDSFVNLEHPFVAGDIVRIIGTDEIGVVRFCSDLERIQEIEKNGIILGIQ